MNEPPADPDAPAVAGDSSPADESLAGLPESPPASPEGAFSEDEKTVISSNPPSTFHTIPAGLHPRELGQILVGQRLDDLWLEEYVGGGGMGAVFRALDTKLHRYVAVKVLSSGQSGDIDTSRRFQVEAQSAARLDHPNIARVHYVGEDRGVPYIVFEYIEGTNLRDLVYQNGPLPVAVALNYTIQIADALLHAWQREVVHRDIKPSNILITQQGQAKLVDMGLARFHQLEHTDGELTSSGMTLGTFDYIAPEQARNPKEADTRSDIYSLGCTLYFMLTGQPPFSGGTALQKLLQHQAEAPPAVEQFRSDVPTAVVSVMECMLAKRIEDRFQNPGELLATLTAAADNLGIGHAPVNAAPLSLPDLRSPNWLKRNLSWLVPIALLLIGVFGMELVLRDQPTQPGFLQDLPSVNADVPDARATSDDETPTAAPVAPVPSVGWETISRSGADVAAQQSPLDRTIRSHTSDSITPSDGSGIGAEPEGESLVPGEDGPRLSPPLRSVPANDSATTAPLIDGDHDAASSDAESS
jgi:serine/threonine-protein kinase